MRAVRATPTHARSRTCSSNTRASLHRRLYRSVASTYKSITCYARASLSPQQSISLFDRTTILVFTALLALHATWSSYRKLFVRLSVRLSNARIFIPYERSFSLVFREKELLVGRPILPEILG